MWLLIHVAVVATVSVMLSRFFGSRHWHGARHAHGCEYNVSIDRDEDGDKQPELDALTAVTIGARTKACVEFELRPETPFDRFCAHLGLVGKRAAGEGLYDRPVFLVADDPYVLTGLRFDPELAKGLRRLLDLRSPRIRRVRRVVCRGGTVRIELRTTAFACDAPRIVEHVAPLLVPLARRLDAAAGTTRPDPSWGAAMRLNAVACAFAVNGVVQALRSGMSTFDPLFAGGTSPWIALGAAAGIVATLAGVAWHQLRGSSRAHHVLAVVLGVGGVGALLTALTAVRDLGL
jgi:hypothetical protein